MVLGPRQGSCGVLQPGVFCFLLLLQSHEENVHVVCSPGPDPTETFVLSVARRAALVPLASEAQLQIGGADQS